MKNKIILICPICSSKDTEEFWAMSGYKLIRCLRCGTVWEPTLPEQTLSIYDKTYFINENPKGGYANYFEGMRINRKTFSDRLKKIEDKLGKKGKLLDVGCALGDFLIEAKARGWKEIEGLELSHYAVNFARQRGLKINEGQLDDNLYSPNTFDVVTYQDVIEHITDPMGELKKIYRILKPGGLVFFITPDIKGLWAKLLGPLWYHYKPREHVIYFSEKSINFALRKAGFINIETSKTHHVLSLEYILNRLRYYYPAFFEFLLRATKKTSLRKIPFKLYTGELEAWGYKPK